MAKIAWLGAGMMGSGFVEALRRRGDEVVVWNRTAPKAKALQAFGATFAPTPRDAAQGVDRVHIILRDDATVDSILDQLEGALAPHTIVIDHTTVAPRPTAARYDRCERAGIPFLHAPVFMSPEGCRQSAGLMLCSGPAERFARVEPELKKMTGELWYAGERVDKAAAFKLFGNQLLFFVIAGLSDVYTLARSVGISAPEAHELFAHFKPNAAIDVRGGAMARGDFTAAFELVMARKDAQLMMDTATAGDEQLAFLPAIAERFDELIAAGYGDKDFGIIARQAVAQPA